MTARLWILTRIAFAGLFFGAGVARADYLVDLEVNAGKSATVRRGETFELSLKLTGTARDRHNAAIVRITANGEGLIYQSFLWSTPYATGTLDDDSKPRLSTLPAALTAGALDAPGYPAGVVDFELSNAASAYFFNGTLVKMIFMVPFDYAGPGKVVLKVEEAFFSAGFDPVNAQPGSFVEITIPPAAGYEEWIRAFFPAGGAEIPVEADPDGDHLANFAEFYFGASPKVPTSRGELPQIRVVEKQPVLEWVRAESAPGATLQMEKSFDLKSWVAVQGSDFTSTNITAASPEFQRVQLSLAGEKQAFFRISVRKE